MIDALQPEVSNDEDRKRLMKRRQTDTLLAVAKKGNKDELMGEILTLPGDAGGLVTFRDDRGAPAWGDSQTADEGRETREIRRPCADMNCSQNAWEGNF